ncbi:MAG: hypothetical protein JW909_14050 [Planctomycetes bacterium]|nr:hypothetical protein [Planctomycetota bacterium]
MLCKPDFEEIIPRMEAWWRGELLDRAAIAVRAPNGRPRREIPDPGSLEARWMNHAWILDNAEASFESTYFAGEAVPIIHPNLGPDYFSALLGGRIEYREGTSWVAPFLDWDSSIPFEINTDSFEWKWLHDMYRLTADRSRGKYLVGAHDCHSGGDALLAMRGGTDICMDLYDRPDVIKATMAKLEKAVVQFHDAFWEGIEANGQRGHASSWLSTWSPGRSNVIQLDLLALISPDMFREFFFHELVVQCGALENTIFHLDGPDAVKHLSILYDLPKNCAAIQWVYGAGNGPMTRWLDLLKQIQSHGMGLHLSCEPGEVETILTELSSKGLYLSVGARSTEEADAMVALASKLAHD